MFQTRNLLVSLAMASALLLPGISRAADVFEYNFQSTYAGPHVLNLQMYQPGVEQLKQASNGRLIVHFFMSGAIAKPEEVGTSVINGNLDIGGMGPQYQDTMFPNTMAFNAPYITRDSVQNSAMWYKAYNTIPEIKAEWDKQVKVLTFWGSDRSGIFSTKGPVLSPADVKGKRVLIWSGGQVDQIKAWGGVPVQVSTNDTYMALQRGMGDLFFGPLPVGVAYKLLEVAKDITILPAYSGVMVHGMNWDAWNELPKDLQEMLEAEFGGESASIRSGRLLYDATNRDLDTMRAAGCTIHSLTDEQVKVFRDADTETTMAFWLNNLKRIGVADPAAALKRAYELAASTPAAE